MLQFLSPGSYLIHEQSRQFAKDKLEQIPKETVQPHNRFGRYYIAVAHALKVI